MIRYGETVFALRSMAQEAKKNNKGKAKGKGKGLTGKASFGLNQAAVYAAQPSLIPGGYGLNYGNNYGG